jgi:hypothetical protein
LDAGACSAFSEETPSIKNRSCQRHTVAFGATHLAHDRERAHPVGAPQHDPRPLHMLLRAIAIRHDRLEPSTIVATDLDFDPRAHVAW